MKKLKFRYSLLLAVIFGLATSCGDDDKGNDFVGTNRISLTTNENTALYESDDDVITVKVLLTKSVDKQVSLNFEVQGDENGALILEGNPVVIAAGEKTGSFKVKSAKKDVIKEATTMKIGINASALPEGMALVSTLDIRLNPSPSMPVLTPAQEALIEGYKKNLGIDLNDWIGLIPVHVKIENLTEANIDPFIEKYVKEYDGKTIMTLSEKSTQDQPVLNMLVNPMGMTEYLYWVLKAETVNNAEYWYNDELVQKEMADLIGWTPTSTESFSASLDNIRINGVENGVAPVEFTGDVEDPFEEIITAIPFVYNFSAWDRLSKLVDEGNEDAIEFVGYGATSNPNFYLISSDLSYDEWEEDGVIFTEPKASLNIGKKEMNFSFSYDHMSAGGYLRVTVTYTSPYKK